MPGLLTALELSKMVATQDSSLDQTCTIARKTTTRDGTGGDTVTYPADGTTTKCRIGLPKQQISVIGSDVIAAASYEFTATFVSMAGRNNPPKMGDRLLSVSDGHSYEVVAVSDDPTYATAYQYGVRRLT